MLGPTAGELGLLKDARLILPPQLYRCVWGKAFANLRQTGGEVFLKSGNILRALPLMAWCGRQLAIAQSAQLAAQCLLGDRQAELIAYPLCQIDQPPTNNPVRRRYRPGFHDLYQCTGSFVGG